VGKLLSPEQLYPPGTILEGKYRLERVLGVGGMSAVFEARHVMLDSTVAVKLLLPEFAKDEEMTTRLVREARAASATGHRNIVTVSDMGHADDGSLFVVMEYIVGRTLKRLIAEEAPLELARAVSFVDQLLCALEVVHRKGIVHRDLKPANLLVCTDDAGEETIKVLDFGISKLVGAEQVASRLTTIGKVVGTPRYMSPEQAVGDDSVDHRADIYSCGVILYELLTGQTQFSASSYHEMVALLLHGDPDPPSKVRPGLPAGVDAVLLRALTRSCEGRYQDATSFRQALRPFASRGATGVASPGVRPERAESSPPAAKTLPAIETTGFCGVSGEHLVEPSGPPSLPRQISASAAAAAPEEEEPLELAESPRSPPSTMEVAPVARAETIYRPTTRSGRGWLWIVVLILAVAAGAGLWRYWGDIMARVRGPSVERSVMLLVETDPVGADVFIDGVLAVTRPIQLPRTEGTFKIQVQAEGYLPEEVDVSGFETQVIRVKLKRRR